LVFPRIMINSVLIWIRLIIILLLFNLFLLFVCYLTCWALVIQTVNFDLLFMFGNWNVLIIIQNIFSASTIYPRTEHHINFPWKYLAEWEKEKENVRGRNIKRKKKLHRYLKPINRFFLFLFFFFHLYFFVLLSVFNFHIYYFIFCLVTLQIKLISLFNYL
jgi:hypothetical protein